MNPYPLLAFDTAADQCAVCILMHDGVKTALCDQIATGQAERLLPMITACLKQAGLTLPQLAAIAVTTGPGSFTGVRVGLAAAHGLAAALNIPAIGIDSFAAFAATTESVCIVIESRRAEKFWQLRDATGAAITQPACDLPETIATNVPSGFGVTGNAAQSILALRPDAKPAAATAGPDIATVARLAAGMIERGELSPALPLYVRLPDARLPDA